MLCSNSKSISIIQVVFEYPLFVYQHKAMHKRMPVSASATRSSSLFTKESVESLAHWSVSMAWPL